MTATNKNSPILRKLKLPYPIFEGYEVVAFGDPSILSQLEQIMETKIKPDHIVDVNKKVKPILNRNVEANKTILHNRATCNLCKKTIESKHRHDFKFCQCGAIFVDGGKDYLRRGGDPLHITERSTFYGKKTKAGRSSR